MGFHEVVCVGGVEAPAVGSTESGAPGWPRAGSIPASNDRFCADTHQLDGI